MPCTVLKQFTVAAKLQIYQKITPGKNSLCYTNLITSPLLMPTLSLRSTLQEEVLKLS